MRAIPFAPLFTQRLNRGEFHSSMGAQAVASGRCAYIMTCSCHGYLYSHAAESKKRNHSSVEWVSLFMVSRDSADTFCSFVANSVASLSFKLSLFLFLFYAFRFLLDSFFVVPVCLLFFGKVMPPKEVVRGIGATLPGDIRLRRIWVFAKYKSLCAYVESFENVIPLIVFCDLHCEIPFQTFV